MKIKLSPFAESDLKENYEYYNNQNGNIGDEFVKEVDVTFEKIKANSAQFPKVYKEMQKALLHRFPFNVFYTVESQIAYILGIFHSSRNPKIMKDRYKTKN